MNTREQALNWWRGMNDDEKATHITDFQASTGKFIRYTFEMFNTSSNAIEECYLFSHQTYSCDSNNRENSAAEDYLDHLEDQW